MRTGFRRALGIVAIATIAMHTALWGGTTTRAPVAAVDPFSVICHSSGEAGTASDPTPTAPTSTPSHACDHCNLCSTALQSASSPAAAIVQRLLIRLSHQLEPASTVAKTGFKISLKGARGPPVAA
jgi:hypothetical protein